MQSNLVGLARGHQGIIDNPPMLAHPCTPLRFHAFLDLIHRQMRGRSGDSMSHVSCSFPSTLSFPLFYHIERDLVSEAVCKGYLEPLKERLDKESFFSCSVLPSSHFKTTLHTASQTSTTDDASTHPLEERLRTGPFRARDKVAVLGTLTERMGSN